MQLQAGIESVGIRLPKYGIDGIFGPETENAVAELQTMYGMPATGVADEKLLARMGLLENKAPVPRTSKGAIGGGVWILVAIAVGSVAYAVSKSGDK